LTFSPSVRKPQLCVGPLESEVQKEMQIEGRRAQQRKAATCSCPRYSPLNEEPTQKRRLIMTAATMNKAPRKSLAEQIDRLDSILDGLAESLDEAVATAAAGAVREVVTVAVQEAVHMAVVEVLTNAELQKRLAASQTVHLQPPVPLVIRLAIKARSCWSWLVSSARSAWSKVMSGTTAYLGKVKTTQPFVATATAKAQQVRAQVVRKAKTGWMLATALATLAKRYRKQVAVAIGVGILVGVACYVGGREVASVGCGLAGFVSSLASDAWRRLRRLLPLPASCQT
jgi:hypothetical protein